jgi:hypothetical protein
MKGLGEIVGGECGLFDPVHLQNHLTLALSPSGEGIGGCIFIGDGDDVLIWG